MNDSIAWQKGAHRARFGVDWEHSRGGLITLLNEPATITLFSPGQARQAKIPLPVSFQTVDRTPAICTGGFPAGDGIYDRYR
jgi:hypothetical protein